jgi:hypothetical protein
LLRKGNDIFIAANSFGKHMTDSLKIFTNYSFFGGFDSARRGRGAGRAAVVVARFAGDMEE